MKRTECGFACPPPDDSHDREVLDAFADFLRIVNDAPRDDEGHVFVSQQCVDYAHGRVDRPCEP